MCVPKLEVNSAQNKAYIKVTFITWIYIVRWNICDIMWDRNLEFGGTYDWEYSNRKSR